MAHLFDELAVLKDELEEQLTEYIKSFILTVPQECEGILLKMILESRRCMRGSLQFDFEDNFRDIVPEFWYWDLPELPAPKAAMKEAKKNSEKIFSSYNLLNQILQRHEPTIQKRWTKKTREQRREILRKAWPNMPTTHRPDWAAFEAEHQATRNTREGSMFKEWFMWPHINQEDLSQPKLMLLLLNARGRNIPPIFAAADWEAMHVGQVTEALPTPWVDKYTMIMNGATTSEEYGKMVEWDKNTISEPEVWIYDGIQFWVGEGLLVLRTQVRTLDFLVNCCYQILHEIPPDELTGSAYSVQPGPSLKTGIDELGYSSIATMAAEVPYIVPSDLNLDRLASLLEAQMSAMEYHIWSLREDPGYFETELLEKRDHSYESVPDKDGKSHPLTMKINEDKLWGSLVTRVAADSYWKLENMALLHRKARNLSVLHNKYKDQVKPTEELLGEYRVALNTF
ncbi:hypothetical protein FPSE_03737 [Fusarium pseudograminearum CS3096]|uniref:Uncharacterized protein n=1 Tax=Fusarium pseudograminearum (strain CS3096) TaxID=1028729 RepID=K3W1L4_FUSPC|nr:hypothetical protein FPSE_03737 [Fusarium pseudograminearum CS3096]EKJ76105.1 hypothetical protein FPSE_03737 [Fusarium pseudograminearum CS3096]KAF0643402.1 hypothetical protein FPSE5266_03737 [Fusarium pseudograminearum]